jgi:RNA polymerase sigma factor (sigma-70 family)
LVRTDCRFTALPLTRFKIEEVEVGDQQNSDSILGWRTLDRRSALGDTESHGERVQTVNSQPALPELLRRLRNGDAEAADELVHTYGPAIRVAIRARLTDPTLRRQFDSEDVCQSVMASFLARAACGELSPEDPAGLLRLLARMAMRKVGRRARGLRTQRRDTRRDLSHGDTWLRHVASEIPSPERSIAGRELLDAVRAGLNTDERQLAELRAEGCSWSEVAERAGGTPEARRKQLRRALDIVLAGLGLEDEW